MLSELGDVQIWARRLALGLVGDAHLAEDVVQDALVASLETRAEVKSPRAWLAGTIRHLSANTRRDRASRRRREEAASPREALPSTVETAERLEAQEILINALLTVEEPFRGALMARYVDGMAPLAIARRDGVPVATVNSRLARGLKRLRASLKHRHGGDETRWIAALIPLVPSIPLASGPAAPKAAITAGAFLMKKTLLVVALVAFLVPLGWKLFSMGQGSDGSVGTVELAAVEGVTPELDAEEPGAPQEVLSLQEPSSSRSLESMTASEPDVVPKAADDLDGAPMQTLRVLEMASGQPVAGAAIWVMSSRRSWNEMRPGSKSFAVEDWPAASRDMAQRHGRHYVTDGEGHVMVPVPAMGSIATVRKGGLHGQGYLTQQTTDLTVYLAPDRRIDVHVVDGSGDALEGVGVRLLLELSEGGTTMAMTMSRARTRATEDDTVASIFLLAEHGFLADDQGGEGPPARWFIAVDAPLQAAVREEVFLDRWPSKPITLELLETGAVTVELQAQISADLGNRATHSFGDGSVVQLFPLTEPMAFNTGFQFARGDVLEEGRRRFTPVGAGVELVAALWPRGPGLPFIMVGRGTLGASNESTITLDPWAESSRVFGRVVDHRGTGIPGLRLNVAFLPGLWIPDGLVTDDEGRFEWRIRLDQPPYAGAEFQLSEPLAPYRLMSLSADRMSDALAQAGSAKAGVDLGDIALPEPAPVIEIVTGRVITPLGVGVPNVHVFWAAIEPETQRVTRLSGEPSRATGEDGRFEIEDFDRGPDAALWVQLSGNHYHDPMPFDVLPRDESGQVLLEVQPGSVLLGSILLDAGVPASGIQVHAWPLATGERPGGVDVMGWANAELDADGRFRLDGLRPGLYSVRAGIGEDHDDAVLVDVEAGAGETQVPPLDLRGLLTLFDSRVVNAEGRVLKATLSMMSPMVQKGDDAYGFPERLGTVRRGRQIVYGTRVGARLMVEAKGYFPVVIDPLEAPDEIVLQRGFDVDLRIVSSAALAETPGELKVELLALNLDAGLPRQIRRSLENRSPSKAVVRKDGTARLRVPAAGEYAVQISIDYEVRPGYHLARKLSSEKPFRLTIGADSGGVASYEVPVDESAYDHVLQFVRTTFEAWIADGTLPADLTFGEMAAD